MRFIRKKPQEKNKKYKFTPQEDITTFELALIVGVMSGIESSITSSQMLEDEKLMRHLTPFK